MNFVPRIHNVRLGFATSSSSAHSMCFIPKEMIGKIKDKNLGYGFGRERFTAASVEAKKLYVAHTLNSAMHSTSLPEHVKNLIIDEWVDIDYASNNDGYGVDHQSLITLPFEFGTTIPDREFLEEIKRFFMQDDLVILGGSDEDDIRHPLADKYGNFNFPLIRDCGNGYVCRKDESGYWVLFSSEDGKKIRMSFGESGRVPGEASPIKAHAPELVDVKITNQCPYNCKYCYQDSRDSGLHAPSNHLYGLIRTLKELKVFEVAIGGGEPVNHPQFVYILESFRREGIVPNFSTRNLSWLRDPMVWPKVIDNCGAFAYSAGDDLHKVNLVEIATLLRTNGINYRDKFAIHIVLGVDRLWAVKNALKEAYNHGIRVVLLDFKHTGRGRGYRVEPYDKLIEEVILPLQVEGKLPRIDFDTPLAARFEKQLDAAGVSRYLYEVREGGFSCYVDAVSNKIGPYSYCEEEKMIELGEYYDEERFLEAFHQF